MFSLSLIFSLLNLLTFTPAQSLPNDNFSNTFSDSSSVKRKWIIKGPEALPGAILPQHRIVAFYGNLYSKSMGILGQLPPEEMLKLLDEQVVKWEKADPKVKVKPALHLIAVTAQSTPGSRSSYSLRMPHSMIDSVINMAKTRNALVFLDIQVGHSTLQTEIPLLEKYLQLPNVHLGIDAEFSMKNGAVPGKKIGMFDAVDINYASSYLQTLVKEHNLSPKILVVHRFTKKMITNSKNIHLSSEVQIVMNMDGWGSPMLKKNTYRQFIYKEPVQYTGFKLFFKNDAKDGSHMMGPSEVLTVYPQPLYIQYQ